VNAGTPWPAIALSSVTTGTEIVGVVFPRLQPAETLAAFHRRDPARGERRQHVGTVDVHRHRRACDVADRGPDDVPPLTAERIAEPLRKQRLGLEGNDAGAEQVKDPAAVPAIGAHVEHEVAGR
jgi:hypothetical protein